MKVIDWAERRIKRRHKAPDLQLTIRTTGLKRWLLPSFTAQCLDFNRYGMAVQSDKLLKPKERILISFKGKYITQSNVPGLVTQCIPSSSGYRISVRFAYAIDAKNYCRKTDNALSRIESLYNPCCQDGTELHNTETLQSASMLQDPSLLRNRQAS